MTTDAFYHEWDGRQVPSRGGITGQCVSLVQRWAEENGVSGTPVFPVPAAKDMVNARPDTYQWIPNTPSGVPGNGDIVVWGTGVGPYGHTAVFIDGDANNFRSFDQNWPTGSAAHVQNHNYNGVAGWLRLKGQAQTPQGEGNMTPDQERKAYQVVLGRDPEPGVPLGQRTAFHFIEDAATEVQNNRAQTAAQLKQLNDRVNEQQTALDKANKLITELQGDNNSAALTKKITELQKQIEDLQNSNPSSLDSYSLGELLSAAFKKTFKIK